MSTVAAPRRRPWTTPIDADPATGFRRPRPRVYIQKDPPGAEKDANWLPAPDGPIHLVMRLSWPRTEPPSILPIGEGTWTPPAIVAVQ